MAVEPIVKHVPFDPDALFPEKQALPAESPVTHSTPDTVGAFPLSHEDPASCPPPHEDAADIPVPHEAGAP